MLVKICGITTVAVARAAQESGADFIGMVFVPGKRHVDLAVARRISREVKGVGKVGVFANAPAAAVREIAGECGLDFVQLHGGETAEYCRQVGVPAIKAVRADKLAGDPAKIVELNAFPAAWLLLDSFANGQFGGSGIPFDWEGLQQLRQQIIRPLLIAGGLDCGNVGTAIRLLAPDGVDVSGGVETNGAKDADKIARFISAVRGERAAHA
ncbi:MAG: phosphoribosylanthranilate isomerase [Negativicutes bacterium]|nr:phosphoribosylanthranilate isomerase [Negativicutes bacterium]